MITDFLKSMSPVDLNPPPRVPYIECGEVGCRVWGEKSRLLSPESCLLSPESCLLNKDCGFLPEV